MPVRPADKTPPKPEPETPEVPDTSLLVALFWGLISVGAISLLMALQATWSSWSFASGAETVQGMVTRKETIDGREQAKYMYVVSGKEFSGLASPSYSIGDSIPLLYSKARPAESRIDSFGARWSSALRWLAVSLLLLAAGAAGLSKIPAPEPVIPGPGPRPGRDELEDEPDDEE